MQNRKKEREGGREGNETQSQPGSKLKQNTGQLREGGGRQKVPRAGCTCSGNHLGGFLTPPFLAFPSFLRNRGGRAAKGKEVVVRDEIRRSAEAGRFRDRGAIN